ncbi:PIN domain-containing protein [Xanthomonas sp. NCPPB 2632]|uniref:PIN domain-containing protein n=1 Tax=Xanthomonas sp. NCPPB 2632 TaxID=3240912 RepID=UPI0035144652
MNYVFDNGPFSRLKHYYPTVFKSVWAGLEQLIEEGAVVSTKEVWTELQNGEPNKHVHPWLKARKHIFTVPSAKELGMVGQILAVPHFQAIIGEKQRLRGTPVADPFVVAAAWARDAAVVTEEQHKPNASKIPNVCEHFKVRYLSLEEFMAEQGWTF